MIRKSFNSERDRFKINSLFLECKRKNLKGSQINYELCWKIKYTKTREGTYENKVNEKGITSGIFDGLRFGVHRALTPGRWELVSCSRVCSRSQVVTNLRASYEMPSSTARSDKAKGAILKTQNNSSKLGSIRANVRSNTN